MKKTIILIFALFMIVSCGDDPIAEAETGTLGGNCYPNGTCNQGLECSSDNRCVETAATDSDPSDTGDPASDNDPADSGESDSDADPSDPSSDDEPAVNPDAECGNGEKEPGEVCEKGERKACSEIDSSYKSGEVECNDYCSGWLTVNCMASEIEPLATFPARTHEFNYLYDGLDAYLEQENILDELWTSSLFSASITINGETYSSPHPQANTHWIAAYYDSSSLSFYQNSYFCDDEMDCQFTTPAVLFGVDLSSLKAGNELSIGISDENKVNMLIEDIMNADDCVMLVGYGSLTVDAVKIAAGDAGNFSFTTSKIGLYLPVATPEGDMSGELENAGFEICK